MLSHLDLNLYAGGQLELHEGVNGLGVAVLDVEKPAVRIELELLAGLLVDEGRAVDGEDLLVGRERNRSVHLRASSFHRVDDLSGGLVYQHVIERLEFNSNFLIHINLIL